MVVSRAPSRLFPIRGAILTAAILLSAMCSASAEPVRVGTSKTGMLIWLADAKGYLDGLDIILEEIGSGVVAANRVADGSLTFGTSSEFAFISKTLSDPTLCVYATISASRTTRLISRSDRIGPTPEELAGSRIAVTPNGIGQYFLSQYLALSGLGIESVTLVHARPDEIVRLINDGEVDAAMTWEPHVSQIRKSLGDLAIDYPDQADQYYYFVLHGRCVLSDEAAATLPPFLKALHRAELFAQANPDEAKRILANRLSIDFTAIEEIWPQHSFVVVLPQDLIKAIEAEAEWRIENGLAEGPTPNVLDFVQPAPLKSVAPQAVRMVY